MAKNRMIAKSCPKCDQQVAVASKSCKCGYAFFQARRIIRGPSPTKMDERRRTGRVRREKPNFYDSQQFDKKHKKRPRRPKQFYNEEKLAAGGKETAAIRAKRRQKKKEEGDGGFDMVAKLSPEKQNLAAIILDEINRKLGVVQGQV